MGSNHKPLLPEWAPRISQEKIYRFYENDAQGIYDEELIDEVGFGLWSRCQSFIEACEAVKGRVRCPSCGNIVTHTRQKGEILHCTHCAWELSWDDYFHTIQHRQLSGAERVIALFQEYVEKFPQARGVREKVLLIDRLIHGFHWYYKDNTPTRPVAINLIQGRLSEVIAFLDSLSAGEGNTPGIVENRKEWEWNMRTARGWYSNPER
jgi:hypothetical protein